MLIRNEIAKKAIAYGGGAAAIRAFKGSRLRILMYHRFPGDATSVSKSLSRQLRHLIRHYHPVSLTEACESIRSGPRLHPRAVAVTVDDGYADFLNAWPVFQAMRVPVTFFVVSRFIDRAIWLWPDIVLYCTQHSPQPTISIDLPDGTRFERPLNTPAERVIADEDLDTILLAAPDRLRRQIVADLPQIAAVELPCEIPNELAPVSWDDLRAMSRSGLDIGAHTRTHPLLSRLPDAATVRDEIAGSKHDIQQSTGAPVRHFCYPNGTPADYDADSIRTVEEAGFLTAVTTVRGANAPGAKRFELMRIGVSPEMPAETFALELAGYRMP